MIVTSVLVCQLEKFYRNFISSISRLWRHSTFDYLHKHWWRQWKNYMKCDVAHKYISFWKVSWQFNNSSRTLQEIFKSQTTTKRTPETITRQIWVPFKLSNKDLVGRIFSKKFHHFFPTNFSQRIHNSCNNSILNFTYQHPDFLWLVFLSYYYWGVLTMERIKYGANGQKVYFFW